MQLKYPASFFLMIFIGAAFLGLSVLWSLAHMVMVLVALAFLPVLRWQAHREGRRS